MSRETAIAVDGSIVEVLPNHLFRVELRNGHRFVAHTAGEMRLSFTRLSVGDRVEVEMSPFDLSKGCIRLKKD